MSERSERLFGILSKISEDKIDEAIPAEGKKQVHWKRWGAIAAAFALVTVVGSYILPRLAGSAIAGGAGADGASTFMSYAGPVFPLTLKEADNAITAEREITLDFAHWEDQQYSIDIQVTDAYTLANTSQEDKTVLVLYPFVSCFTELDKYWPALTADDQELETALHAGEYSGGYQGVWGGTLFTESKPGSVNLLYADNWEDYKTLVEGTDYLEKALLGWPDFSDVSAIVYKFTDPWGAETDNEADILSPNLHISFDLDYSKTGVVSYGFGGTSQDLEKGWMSKQLFIPQSWEVDAKDPCYLIVIGEDIGPIDTQGYAIGGWDTRATMEAGVTVRRYETNLEDALRTVLQQRYDRWGSDWGRQDFELFLGLMKDQLLNYGSLSADPMERYLMGDLENLDAHQLDRVFYLEAGVTIPAGESVHLTAKMTKGGSYDFYCTHAENQGVNGYDMVTKLGSNLIYTQQTALLEDWGQIEIVRQNFGFNLENGLNRVTLDPEQEHYYLEVKGRFEK